MSDPQNPTPPATPPATPPPPQNPAPPASPAAGQPPPAQPQPPASAQAELEAALRTQAKREAQQEFNARLKELAGVASLEELNEKNLKEKGEFQKLAEVRQKEADGWREKFQRSTARSVLADAAVKAGALDVEDVHSHLLTRAQVNDEGAVSIDGKTPEEAVKELLARKPHLARSSGNQGSGAAGNRGSGKPWDKMTLTEKSDLYKRDPAEYQRRQAAGA